MWIPPVTSTPWLSLVGAALIIISPKCEANDLQKGRANIKEILTVAYYGEPGLVTKVDDGIKEWQATHNWFREIKRYTGRGGREPFAHAHNEVVAVVRIVSYKPGNVSAFIIPFAGAKEVIAAIEFRDYVGRRNAFTIKLDSRPLWGLPPLAGNVAERVGTVSLSTRRTFAGE